MYLAQLILAAITYISPVHFDVLLAGNFGEPRPNHFHGGLDIKTQREEGKAIYAIGDGFVSRVTVNVGGMGNALYVRHPEGYTSVYAHLQRFAPAIEAVVRKWQYENQSTDVDMELDATDCPVAQGQLIALSGDTGASMGPHLHLEIHQTDNWDMKDPLEFIPDLLQDSVCPKAHAIMAYPFEGEGVFCGDENPQRFDFMDGLLPDTLYAWGKVGFALNADDYMQGSENRYGVKFTALFVDGNEVFRSVVDDIPVADNRMVNVWGDYDYFIEHQEWFMRSFVLPGNRLHFIKTDKNNGVVCFNEEKKYKLTYVLCDFFGNEAKYSFVVNAVPTDMTHSEPTDSLTFDMDKDNDCKMEGMSLNVPKGALLNHVLVEPSAKSHLSRYSDGYMVSGKSIPLMGKAHLKLRLDADVDDNSKLYISALKRTKQNELDLDSSQRVFVGGHYNDGWMEGDVDDIGNVFTIDYDNEPPQIIPLLQKMWEKDAFILVDLKDSHSGVSKFQGFLDGQFVLFDHVKKSSKYCCFLKDTPIEPNGKLRQLRMLAQDNVGNETVFDTTLKY